MPRKKKEETVEKIPAEVSETELSDKVSAEAGRSETANNNETADNKSAASEEPSLISSVFETVTSVVGDVAEAVVGGATNLVSAVTGDGAADDSPAESAKTRKRAEKIGTVQSDKMTKTVTVRVDRVVKHPMYRKYVKRRKKFMAHDELGAKAGDKVRIVETRPLSARKRWRVVEIIQKAER